MSKTANVNGFCPHFSEEVSISATFTNCGFVGADIYATPMVNLCPRRSECGRGTNPDECPVFNQDFLWNRL